MKKALSVFLSVLMILSVFSCLFITASAAVGRVPYLNITVTEPEVGAKPVFDATVTSQYNGQVSNSFVNNGTTMINGVEWYDTTASKNLGKNDTFVAGHVYNVSVLVTCANDYRFSTDPSLFPDPIKCNGNAGGFGDFYHVGSYEGNDKYFYASYTFPVLEDSGAGGDSDEILTMVTYEIEFTVAPGDPVEFSNILQYGEGKHIDKTYNSDGFVNGVKWISSDMSSPHKKGDRFHADTEYTLTLRIAADDGYSFSSDVVCRLFAVSGTIDATIVDFDSKYIVAEFEFTNNGCYPAGWNKASDGKWLYYFTDEGDCYTNCWAKIGGKWYHFDASGAMQTGWLKIGGKWYYLDKSGAMLTGWQKISGKWYYFNTSGVMLTGWQKISKKWYYFNSSGAMLTGWQKISGKWYYFNASGVMQTGWLKLSGKWYYFDASGYMLANCSRKIGSKTYKFNSSGVCTNP